MKRPPKPKRPKIGDFTGQVIRVRWTESELYMHKQMEREDKIKSNKMKKLSSSLILAVALAFAVAPAVVVVGCKTTSQTSVYKTLASVETAVDAAFKSYLDLVVKGSVPSTNLKGISNDYAMFQGLMQAAITAAQGNTAAIASQALIDAGAQVLNEIVKAQGGVK